MTIYDSFTVAVEGGDLFVGRWGRPDAPPVIALHGLTSPHRDFARIADELGDDVCLIAPDLRGRAQSAEITGPFSMAAHADDAAAVLDHLGLDKALVVGHSMGGFAAVVMADRHADRIARMVWMDGGLPLNLPEAMLAMPIEDLTTAVVGPVLDRLERTWTSVDEYFDYWRANPAASDEWSHWVEDRLRYDLVGEAPELTIPTRSDAIVADVRSELVDDHIPKALENLRVPTRLVRAERGIFNTDPLYDDAWVAEWVDKLSPHLTDEVVADTNHYTIAFGKVGAAAMANVITEELGAAGLG